MAPPRRYPPATGPDDFRQLREFGNYYVDKSGFVAEVLSRPEQVLLLPRPRRFGKSLNLSTLRYYLDNAADHRHLFDDLAIATAPAEIRAHQGRYPVVLLLLKDVKVARFEDAVSAIALRIAEAAQPHRYLLDSVAVDEETRGALARLLRREATGAELAGALRMLLSALCAHHGVGAALLIDEYDVPIEAGFTFGYYDEMVTFMRNLLGGALKTNPSLFRAVLTGVRRISKESLFSGLNNVRVCSMLEPAFRDAFGFTEPEVAMVLAAAGLEDRLQEVRDWYNGYLFGGQVIYNPWSVLSYANQGIIKEYWGSTSSEELLRELLTSSRDGLEGPFETLLRGGEIEATIDEHVVLRDLRDRPEALWSFLLTAGYLKAGQVAWEEGEARATLSIPNREIHKVWRRQFQHWLAMGLGGSTRHIQELAAALFRADVEIVEDQLRPLLERTLSSHDTGQGPGEPERVYQAFVLGLLAHLEPRWQVRSNRESGHGRADVLLLPAQAGQPGAVLELKRLRRDRGETPESAVESALAQLRDRDYASEVWARGASSVALVGIVFEGKRVWVGRG